MKPKPGHLNEPHKKEKGMKENRELNKKKQGNKIVIESQNPNTTLEKVQLPTEVEDIFFSF